jgi:tetratricopeptide (TPR) repeat protein
MASKIYVFLFLYCTVLAVVTGKFNLPKVARRATAATAICSSLWIGSACSMVISPDVLLYRPISVAVAADGGEYEASVNGKVRGSVAIQGEAASIYRQAVQCESDGDYETAQSLYEQVIQVEPDFIFAWSNLGNVLTARGNLDQALLCYKKAISLYPPRDQLAIIVLNKASIELSTGKFDDALKDLDAAELLAGPKPSILSVKAVALTNQGRWADASQVFEKVISTADRNALPWWLRYSMTLLETNRGMEAVAFYQRTLKSFPNEPEIKAFGAALYTALGASGEANSYWTSLSSDDQAKYAAPGFVDSQLKWGPTAVKNFKVFLSTR